MKTNLSSGPGRALGRSSVDESPGARIELRAIDVDGREQREAVSEQDRRSLATDAFDAAPDGARAELAPRPSSRGEVRSEPQLRAYLALLAAKDGADHRASRRDRDPEEDDRAVARILGQTIALSPYARSPDELCAWIEDEPSLRGMLPPDLAFEDLLRWHERFPAIVPDPRSADARGSIDYAIEPLIEGWVAARRRPKDDRPAPASVLAKLFDSVPRQELGPLIERIGAASAVCLRRIVTAAPPSWGADEIAAAFNRSIGHYAELMPDDERDQPAPLDTSWLTSAKTSELLAAFPKETGALHFRERQHTLRQVVATAFAHVEPGTNIYALAEDISAKYHVKLAAIADRTRRVDVGGMSMDGVFATYGVPASSLLHLVDRVDRSNVFLPGTYIQVDPSFCPRDRVVFAPDPPAARAILTPEAVVRLISGTPELRDQVATLVGGRPPDELDATLAEEIARTFGDKLAQFSPREIAGVMAKKNPLFDEALVRRLMLLLPERVGARGLDASGLKLNYLLAHQVADAMEKMFAGATLDDVAKFLKAQTRGFDRTYPDFSAADVRLLQQAYGLVPQWQIKPDSPALAEEDVLALDSLLEFAALTFSPEDTAELRSALIDGMEEGLASEQVPPGLRSRLDRLYAQSLLEVLLRTLERVPFVERASLKDPSVPPPNEARLRIDRARLAALARGGDEKAVARGLAKVLPATREQRRELARLVLAASRLDVRALSKELPAVLHGVAARNNLSPLTASKNLTEKKARSITKEFNLAVANLALGRDVLLTRIERGLFQNRELKASLQRFARIPLRLPLVQTVVERYERDQPLADKNVLLIQHMLGQAYPQISGYCQLGMNASDAIFVGIPYHRNEEVEKVLARSFGLDVRVPPKDMDALYRAIEKAVDDLVTGHLENGKDGLVVCDGPHARTYFSSKYQHLADHFCFTEQTSFGDRPEYRDDRSLRVVSYARTRLKSEEAKFVGQSVARAVNAVLSQLGTGYEEKPVLILGFGPVGQATAAAFHGDRAQVFVYDPYLTRAQRHAAEELGYEVLTDRRDIARGKFMLIGCSGHRSIEEEDFLASDPSAIYVSASSKLVEIDMPRLRELSTDEQGRVRKILAAQVNDQDTWHYWLTNGKIRTVVADGLPANFNDINVVPPEFIDITMALSLAAAVQAVDGHEPGFTDLRESDHRMLDEVFQSLLGSRSQRDGEPDKRRQGGG